MNNRYLKNVVTLTYDPEKCTGCGMCLEVCPHRVFALSEGKARITDRD
ncbi:MAG: ATP-binding protein, partial [Candidatus Aminicenantales bacterium]